VDKQADNFAICQDQAPSAYALYQKYDDIARVRIGVDKGFRRPLSENLNVRKWVFLTI